MKRLLFAAAAAAALLVMTAFLLVVRVPEGGAALVEEGPAGSPARALQPGVHLRWPGSRVMVLQDLKGTSSGEVMVTPVSGGEVPLRYTVSGRLDPARIVELQAAMAGRGVGDFLAAQAASRLRDEAARTDAVELLTPAYRQKAAGAIQEMLAGGGVLEASVVLGPPDDETLMAAAQYLASRGEGYKIRQTVSEAMLDPERAKSWKLQTAMGYIDASEKLFDDAEKDYLSALALEPAAIAPMAELVALYSGIQDWTRLRRILDAALTARPESPQHLNWTAMVMARQDDAAGAERLLRKGLELDPDNHIMMANLGALMMKQNRRDEAMELFRRAVEVAPDSQQALFNLGTILAMQDRYGDALPFLERAAQAGSMNAPLARTLALALQKTGETARAAGYLKQAETLEAAARPRARSKSQPGPQPGR
jgi:tetratricopeptide (TPR) repeat protein